MSVSETVVAGTLLSTDLIFLTCLALTFGGDEGFSGLGVLQSWLQCYSPQHVDQVWVVGHPERMLVRLLADVPPYAPSLLFVLLSSCIVLFPPGFVLNIGGKAAGLR